MLPLLAVTCLAGLAGTNLLLKRGDLFYPATMQTLIWLFIVALYAIFGRHYIQLNESVFLLVLFSCGSFSLGCLASAGAKLRATYRSPLLFKSYRFEVTMGALTWLSSLALFALAYRAHQIAHGTNPVAMYAALRSAVTGETPGQGFGAFRYLFFLIGLSAASSSLTDMIRGRFQPSRRSVYLIIVAILSGLISTSRSILLTNVILFLLPLVFFGRMSLRAAIATITMIFVPPALAMAIVLGKLTGTSASFSTMLSAYFVAPFVALSTEMKSANTFGGGEHTFRFFVAILHAFGIAPKPASLIQPFVYVPTPTNIYTSLYTYYIDFGFIGVVFVEFILGAIHGLFYRLVAQTNATPATIFVFFVTLLPIFSTYSAETDFSQLSLWLQYGFGGYIVLNILPRVRIGNVGHRDCELELRPLSV